MVQHSVIVYGMLLLMRIIKQLYLCVMCAARVCNKPSMVNNYNVTLERHLSVVTDKTVILVQN